MLSFASGLSPDSDAFAIFVTEKYELKDESDLLSKDVVQKVNLLLKSLKLKNQGEEINSFDISSQKKCFIIKVKNKRNNSYFEEIGGMFFTNIKKFKNINLVDIYADSLNEKKDNLIKFFSEFIFGFNLKSYTFNKYKTFNKEKINKKINFKIITSNKSKIENNYKYYDAIKDGVFLTRDLVSEPPNILNPKAYVKKIKKLSKLGLNIFF